MKSANFMHDALTVTRYLRFGQETYSCMTEYRKSSHKCIRAVAGVTTSSARNVKTMSEGSKMGLFGSKDRNQEQKEKSSKDNSPARYAPYGVDSDTETYDTEALSMMDINDIIGVQSGEQVGDSTLESEIAALSQIITESKMESTSQLNPKSEMQQDASKDAPNSTSNIIHATNIDNIDYSNTDESTIMSEKCAANEICETQKATLDYTHKEVTCEKLSASICAKKSILENTEMDSIITCDKTSGVNINEIIGDATIVSALESSSKINSPNVTLDDTLQETFQIKQQIDALPKDHKKDIEKTKDQSVDETHENQKTLKNNTKSVVTVGSISKSLQLIGEAYNSEDSEETDVNDSDFSKETPSFSQETFLLGVSTIEQEKKIIEENSEIIDVSEQDIEKTSLLNDNASAIISEESKVNVTDSKMENSNIEKSEDSSQNELLQQTLEIQENIDDSISNKITEFDTKISSGMHEQNENNSEINKVNIMEGMSLEFQSSNVSSQESIDTLADVSITSSMELVNLEECQEKEIKNTGSELNISVNIHEVEKQDSLVISNEQKLDAKKINDNCTLIDDNDIKDISKDKNTLLESASETQDSIISEVSDKKLSITEVLNKSDDPQEENIIESCQTTQEITSITNKINDESQETAIIKIDLASTTIASNNEDDLELANTEETIVLNDKNTFQTASSVINEELVFSNENTSLSQPHVEEKNVTTNKQSLSDNLSSENLDLCSTNLITQTDANSTNINNSVKTTIHTEKNLFTLESSLIPIKHDEPVKQLPSILEIPKCLNDVNDIVYNKLEDLSVPILYEDSSNTIENINESLHEAEEIEKEIKISEVTSLSINKNQNELPLETKSQQICDQSESHISDKKSDACTNKSTEQIEENNVTNSLCNTITEKKEDKTEENVTIEISNEKKIKENETCMPNEKDVLKSEKSTEAETCEINSVLEMSDSRTDSKSDVQMTKDDNLQADEVMKPCDETAKISKKESEELIDVNIMSIVEQKSMEPIVEKSINTTDIQSSDINIINMSLIQENSNERTNTGNLTEELSQDSGNMNASIVMQTTNTLEGLLSLNLTSDNKSPTLKDIQTENNTLIKETVNKDVDIDLLFDQVNQGETTMTENSDSNSITNVIADCLTNKDNESEVDINAADKTTENEDNSSLKTNKNINTEPVNEITDEEKIKEPLEADNNLAQNDLEDMDFEDNRLESVEDLEESEAKLELPQDILLESVMPRDNLSRNIDTPIVTENSQSSSEISELESAVKFLQESEEQTIDSPLVLSPKMMESIEVLEDITKVNAELYVSDEIDNYVNAESELANLRNVAVADSISISEAEIISEAAKLENERKFSAQIRNTPDIKEKDIKEINKEIKPSEEMKDHTCLKTLSENVSLAPADTSLNMQVVESMHEEKNTIPDIKSLSSEGILKTCEKLPRVSILEERLKEPPKIEIPVPDSSKILESSISPNDNLLIPKDARAIAYSRMLESPKSIDKSELKCVDTPRKDLEKHSDPENVGSPRIILKIAKSAITDCSEPRSPKSPKIRSATNSPNPEDSPGQKLGKIKLKLSKGGHPSIISNENLEDINQWHTTDNAPSLSPLGMKIKLSKSGDASIIGSEKHEHTDETKYKIEESKRTDSPIGMKIKLSKSGDASIISDSRQQDCTKEILTKHKEKLEIPQGSPKRTESPIGMKIKLSKSGDASIIQTDRQESLEELHRDVMPKRTDSPIGMKIKLSKTGDASIVSPDVCEDAKDSSTKAKDKQDNSELPKRTESPIGMKIKLTKSKGSASIISVDNIEDTKELQKLEVPEPPKRTESPLGMKIKLSKTGDASIIHSEVTDDIKETRHKEKSEVMQDTTKTPESLGFKFKMLKTGEMTSSILPDMIDEQVAPRSSESFTGIIPKIKVSKSDALIAPDKTEPTKDLTSQEDQQAEVSKRTESPLGMKIKLSKSGDASIIQSETVAEDHQNKTIPHVTDTEYSKSADSSLGMKIKLFKTGDASVVEAPSSSSLEKKDKQQRRRDAADSPLEIKIKLSKTGHPTIVACDNHSESSAHKGKDSQATLDPATLNFPHRYMEHATIHKESALKILKTGHHSSILQGNRAELTIEPVQMQNKKQPTENVQQIEISPKRKDIMISPVESKKSKLEAQLSQILPEVTIQPVMCRDQKQQQQQLLFDPKSNLISRQQMNVINQEISITQVRSTAKADNASSVNDKLKDLLCKNATNSPGGSSDCEIIEHRPELIIVNENSNSSQDVVIIEEVTPNRMADIKVPKKRGRPRRNPIAAQQHVQQSSAQMLIPKDPLALDEMQQVPPQQFEHRENERPKRTCRNQKSYAPPKRGRGRGRGKRKLDNIEPQVAKKSRIDQDLSAIEASTMAVITIDETTSLQQDSFRKSSELYKALKQPPIDRKSSACKEKHIALTSRKETGKRDSAFKASESDIAIQLDPARLSYVQEDPEREPTSQTSTIGSLASKVDEQHKRTVLEIVSEKTQKTAMKQYAENKGVGKMSDAPSRASEIKEIPVPPPGHSNWLTPTSKKLGDSTAIRGETVSTVQVIDEETRMSAESGSRSQTPARNISAPASETIINEESQGSVLSTATTESEKVKVKNRRMEINFDPDEGPFTVDKIAEYEWPLDRKGETFMIQEQISQYLGVKSFKRKYPDLKRRVVDMEERNYLRENGLVSEAMCDMGLTAVCSSEVLDVMCSDFPDQYEEYRKHMREKQVKEHSKKQKELTAAANAEKNRIDLAEMAVQSAFAWNSNLNKARKENRKCCLDLQTFTIHIPKKQQKVDSEHKVGHYPVALIPGQYTDYYREYTPAELRYYPLNTVLYGPTRPNERKCDSQSEGSQSDSDSESSSDDSSSSSSEGTQDTEGSQSTMDDVDMEISNSKDDIKLKCKMCLKVLNKHNKNEILIQCGTCNGNVHPSCIDLTLDMVPHIQSYAWQCTDCKTCAQCHDPADEDKMLFCDMCDRGYHIYCVGLRRVPQGRWHCQECAVCANCGSREAGGANSDRNSVAQWQHEYKKGERNTRVYVSTLCVPCSKLWRKGRYCPHCSRCHTAQRLDLEANLVHCSACDKYLHLECVETKGLVVDKKKLSL